jgi:hypothetical protein
MLQEMYSLYIIAYINNIVHQGAARSLLNGGKKGWPLLEYQEFAPPLWYLSGEITVIMAGKGVAFP